MFNEWSARRGLKPRGKLLEKIFGKIRQQGGKGKVDWYFSFIYFWNWLSGKYKLLDVRPWTRFCLVVFPSHTRNHLILQCTDIYVTKTCSCVSYGITSLVEKHGIALDRNITNSTQSPQATIIWNRFEEIVFKVL